MSEPCLREVFNGIRIDAKGKKIRLKRRKKWYVPLYKHDDLIKDSTRSSGGFTLRDVIESRQVIKIKRRIKGQSNHNSHLDYGNESWELRIYYYRNFSLKIEDNKPSVVNESISVWESDVLSEYEWKKREEF